MKLKGCYLLRVLLLGFVIVFAQVSLFKNVTLILRLLLSFSCEIFPTFCLYLYMHIYVQHIYVSIIMPLPVCIHLHLHVFA